VTTAVQPTFQQILADDKLYFETFIEIEDRNRNPIQFKLNPAQEIVNGRMGNRNVIIKASQLGSTTFFLARYLKRTLTIPGTTSIVMAHERFLTQRLLTRAQYMYDHIPSKVKPKMHHKSAHEKSFPSINSVMYIGTAGADVFGRGEPIHNFLGSEYMFWPDLWNILTPTMQRVPLDGEMTLESTPNGEGNDGYELVQDILGGDSIWNLTPLYWWYEPEYRIPMGSPHALTSDRGKLKYDLEETTLIKRVGWEDAEAEERIRWRRRKISEIKHEFLQEFVEDMVSCFLASGDAYYDQESLNYHRTHASDPPFHFKNAEVWYEPEHESPAHYICTVDPGQGKITQSVATVWRLWPTTQQDGDGPPYIVRHEATLSGLYDPIAFAPLVLELARYYKGCMIASENNGHGMAFSAEIKSYPNLYYQRDIVSGYPSLQIGWKTTGTAKVGGGGTKAYMMAELHNLVTKMKVHDLNIIRELMQVRYSGQNLVFLGNDDFHDATAIMAAVRNHVLPVGDYGYQGETGFKW